MIKNFLYLEIKIKDWGVTERFSEICPLSVVNWMGWWGLQISIWSIKCYIMLPFVIWSIEMYAPETRTGIPLPDFRFYAYSSQEIAKPRVGYNLIGYILTKGLDIGRSVSLFRFLSLHSAQISTLVLLRCLHLIREFKVFGVNRRWKITKFITSRTNQRNCFSFQVSWTFLTAPLLCRLWPCHSLILIPTQLLPFLTGLTVLFRLPRFEF